MQEVTTGMREMGINNLEWVDREGWRKKNKIKTLDTGRCESIKTLYINNIKLLSHKIGGYLSIS